MLFVEHSLLSRPPASSELDSNENQPVSAGPRPSAASAGAAESSPEERETPSRPEQRPAVQGCVEMTNSDLHAWHHHYRMKLQASADVPQFDLALFM